MLFWPISSDMFTQANEFGRQIFTSLGYPHYSDFITFDVLLELVFFLTFLLFLIRSDHRTLLSANFHNLVLIIPAVGIIYSNSLSIGIPIEITIAQTVFLLIFGLSILKACRQLINRIRNFYERKNTHNEAMKNASDNKN